VTRLGFGCSCRSNTAKKPETIAAFSQVAFDQPSMLITEYVAHRHPLSHFVAEFISSGSRNILGGTDGVTLDGEIRNLYFNLGVQCYEILFIDWRDNFTDERSYRPENLHQKI
jgi:hypothetical protein